MKKISNLIREKNFDKFQNHKYEDEVKSAMWDYVAGYTTAVNDELRKGRKVDSITSLMDKGFTDKKVLDVYRTVDWNYMKNMYNITPQNIQSQVGKTIVNKGYMSTASTPTSPWADRWLSDELVLHITSTRPVNCLVVNDLFKADEIDCAYQNEILLPRNTSLTITGVELRKGKLYAKEGTWFVEVEIK